MRTPLALIALVLLAPACGGAPATASTSTDQLTLTVRTAPTPLVSGQPATFDLEVANTGDGPVTIAFDTTERGDVALETQGVEVYRWSRQRAFAQEPVEITVGAGRRVSFPLEEAPLPVGPGDYELLAILTGSPKLQVVRTSLTIVAGPGATGASPAPAPAADETSAPSEPSAPPTP